MSEFQFYEFQTIDRPLTKPEQAEISKLSRRDALTPTSAVFTYQFGDFPARVETLIQKYNARGYEEAVQLVSKLGAVAIYRHSEAPFQTRLEEISARYSSRHSLLSRLSAARLPRR